MRGKGKQRNEMCRAILDWRVMNDLTKVEAKPPSPGTNVSRSITDATSYLYHLRHWSSQGYIEPRESERE